MDNALYIGIGAQTALRKKMDIVANNIANMNTTAYNKEKIVFKEQLMNIRGEAASSNGKISMISGYTSVRDTKSGAFKITNNPLDLAITGKGYLGVQSPTGEIHYTRNGSLSINDQNMLATHDGLPVLEASGQPISLSPDDTNIKIAADGTISSDARNIGKIAVYDFQNEQSMQRIGSSLYKSNQPAQQATNYSINQGAIENSNVNSIEAISEMMTVSRQYESLAKSLSKLNEMRKESLSKLAKIQ